MAAYEPEWLTLRDEDGNEKRFEVLDVVEYAGDDYAVLFPEMDDGGAVILRIEPAEEGGEESYAGVGDDALLEAVFQRFRELHREELGE